MDLNRLLTLSLDDQLLLLRGEADALQTLWARDDTFGVLFRHALKLTLSAGGRNDLRVAARAFLDTTYLLLVAAPTELVRLASALDEELAVGFVKDYVHSPLAQNKVISGLATQPELFHSLPRDPGWIEVVVLVYGMALLNSSPDRRFTVDELIPLGIEVDRSTSRAVLSSALDAS
jgi:hypothetical protein